MIKILQMPLKNGMKKIIISLLSLLIFDLGMESTAFAMDANPNGVLFPETGQGLGWDNPYRKTYSVYLSPPSDFKPKFQAVGCFCEYQDKILVLKRNPDAVEGNTWGIPGGKIDKDELPRAAAIRETLEETGLDVNSETDLKEMRKHYIHLALFDFVFHMYRMRFPEQHNVKLAPKEHQEYQWLTLHQILKLPLITGEIESFLYYDEELRTRHHISSFSRIPRELTPAKGVTVWREPKKEILISWPSYHDFSVFKKVPFMMDGDLKINIFPYTLFEEYVSIFDGMINYDLSIVNPLCYLKRKFKIDEYGVKGYVFGESAIIETMSLINFDEIILSIENEIFQRGGRRIYISLANAQQEMKPLIQINTENSRIAKKLQAKGYVNISKSRNLKTNEYDSDYMKELFSEGFLDNSDKKLSYFNIGTFPKIEWSPEESLLVFPQYPSVLDKFSVFVRNKRGNAIGCVVGLIENNAVQPHAHINLFFMDESIRGIGLGKKTMKLAEKYIKDRGINLIGLYTHDHEAPLFYEKMGYLKEFTRPKLLKGHDGQYINKYKYLKDIKEKMHL